ncbi:MAG: HD domain-containing protein [Gemmataceae bacterium]|nr:HD domain-containing protein [Gemmataceae bacterium]
MRSSSIELTGFGPKLDGLRWESESLLRIGRQGNLDIVLRDPSVEPIHAEVRFHGQRWIVRNLAKSPLFPTRVNDHPIARSAELKLGDTLQIGNVQLCVTSLGSSDESATPPPQAKANPKLAALRAAIGGVQVATAPVRTAKPVNRLVASVADLEIEATTRRSWDDALAMIALDERPQQIQAMLTLMRTNQHLAKIASLDELVRNVLNDAIMALGAQRGSILLVDPHTGELTVKAMDSPSLGRTSRSHSRTLVERCFRQGESILCRDSRVEHYAAAAKSVHGNAMSSIVCALLRTPRKQIGVLHLDRGPMQAPFAESDLFLADAIAASVAVGIECAQLVDLQRDQFVQSVTTLARAVEMRDQYTGDHTKRVAEYSLLLADALDVTAAERYQIQIGAPLHDVGKIGVDDAVLRKPGRLNAQEFLHIQQHTVKGAEMLQQMFSLTQVIPIVRHHHERWDGTGYPDRIGRDQIALTARIVAVADAFDAMTSHRPYRPAMPSQLAFLELLSKAGTHFDPTCVQAFLQIRSQVEQLQKSSE